MSKLKQISVKLEERTFNDIEENVKRLRYYKRNAIISNVLGAIFAEADSRTIEKLVRHWIHSGKHLDIIVREK